MLGRVPEPLKMTSIICLPRRLLADCSPSTHLMASTTLLLPQPLGPTMHVIPGPNSNSVLSAKLLKPVAVSFLRIIRLWPPCHCPSLAKGRIEAGTTQPPSAVHPRPHE